MTGSRADVIVIGGGVVGASIGYHLSCMGIPVGLLEGGVIGGRGATSYTGALIRSYDPDPAWLELCLRGSILLSRWKGEGYPGIAPMKTAGFFYLAGLEREACLSDHARRTSRRYPLAMLSGREAAAKLPGFSRKARKRVVLHERNGGYGNARLTAQNLSQGLRLNGGFALENLPVTGIDLDGRGATVSTRFGKWRASVVVLASGACIRDHFPGLPITIKSIPMALLEGPASVPMIDEVSQTYFCPASPGRFWCGSGLNREIPVADPSMEIGKEHIRDAAAKAAAILGAGSRARPIGGLVGYDAYTPANRPIIGFSVSRPPLYVATGFSGRGYKSCLSVGEAAACEIAGRLGRKAGSSREAAGLEAFREGLP